MQLDKARFVLVRDMALAQAHTGIAAAESQQGPIDAVTRETYIRLFLQAFDIGAVAMYNVLTESNESVEFLR